MLMRHEGTALLRIADYHVFNRFHHARRDQKHLAEALHQWFQEQYPQEQYPQTFPVCSKASTQAEVSGHH